KGLHEIQKSNCKTFLIANFDVEKIQTQLAPFLPKNAKIRSFDEIRLPHEMLSVPGPYLSPLNFATNFAFFRDEENVHTKLVTANYWSQYNRGKAITIWFHLMDENGHALATWTEVYDKPAQLITI